MAPISYSSLCTDTFFRLSIFSIIWFIYSIIWFVFMLFRLFTPPMFHPVPPFFREVSYYRGRPINLSFAILALALWYLSWITEHFLLHISTSLLNCLFVLVKSIIFLSKFFRSLSSILWFWLLAFPLKFPVLPITVSATCCYSKLE